MTIFFTNRTPLLIYFLFTFSACSHIFENSSDVMARQALFDLMKVQETYRSKHNTYTKEIAKLLKYNLEYNSGIVYLEIHSADKEGYRAISLPAESSTARVFIYDTGMGGFYEADDIEVSKYVLGALNFIRGEKQKQKINFFLATVLLGFLVVLGFRFVSRYNGKENNNALISYFISLLPLGWAITTLNHFNSDIIFSEKIKIISFIAIILAFSSIFITSRWIKNQELRKSSAPVLGLAGCTLFASLTSIIVVAYITYKYHPLI